MHIVDTSADRTFEAAPLYFSHIDPDVVAALVAASSDIALVLDAHGVIRDLSLGMGQTRQLGELQQWVGRRWIETVTVDTRPKISAMLEGAAAPDSEGRVSRPERQVNHPLAGGAELPVSWSVVSLGVQGRIVALGRDLRAVAAVQQRLVDAQQSMERDYLRLRHTEARYRLLFEAIDEAVVVVDALSLTVFEVNGAASRLLGEPSKRILGRTFTDFLHARSQAAASSLFSQVRSLGRSDELGVSLGTAAVSLKMAVSVFKQDNATLLLVRLVQSGAEQRSNGGSANAADKQPSLLAVANSMPDAFVLTDPQGRIISANQAFSEMLQLPSGESVPGQSLDRWLGRSSVDLNVLISNLRQHGVLRLFPTTLRSAFGEPIAVEISAVAVTEGDQACLGFSIRDVARRLGSEARSHRQLPRSAEQLTGLVGRLPLKDIVGETTDLIERLCIEAALELTRDNRASAAEMLGLSRQSLYVKLRRYGIQDAGPTTND
jgi:transcriptional regulator PpsR